MNDQRQLDYLLDAFLAEGPEELADRVIDAALDQIDNTRQRGGSQLSWRLPRMSLLTRVAAGAAVIAIAVGFGLSLKPSPATVVQPSRAPSVVPVPSASVSPPPTPTATPRPAAVIAYINWVYRTNQTAQTSRVWIVGTDGSGARELFPGGTGNQSGVAWSPDGTRLIYSAGPGPGELAAEATLPGLYMTDATGSAPEVVDPGCVAPSCYDSEAAFSSDGTQLVFVRVHGQVSTSWVIATMDLASGRVVELDSTAAFHPERPRWSSNSKQIVFSRLDKFANGSAVFIVDADGRNLRQLSSASLPARLADWSPDGSRIVFTSLVNKIVRVAGDNVLQTTQDVYTMRPDGTDLRRLTTDGNSIGATWTPDGRILFATGSDCQLNCTTSDAGGFWVMNADGSGARLLVPGGSGLNWPEGGIDAAWQPTP